MTEDEPKHEKTTDANVVPLWDASLQKLWDDYLETKRKEEQRLEQLKVQPEPSQVLSTPLKKTEILANPLGTNIKIKIKTEPTVEDVSPEQLSFANTAFEEVKRRLDDKNTPIDDENVRAIFKLRNKFTSAPGDDVKKYAPALLELEDKSRIEYATDEQKKKLLERIHKIFPDATVDIFKNDNNGLGRNEALDLIDGFNTLLDTKPYTKNQFAAALVYQGAMIPNKKHKMTNEEIENLLTNGTGLACYVCSSPQEQHPEYYGTDAEKHMHAIGIIFNIKKHLINIYDSQPLTYAEHGIEENIRFFQNRPEFHVFPTFFNEMLNRLGSWTIVNMPYVYQREYGPTDAYCSIFALWVVFYTVFAAIRTGELVPVIPPPFNHNMGILAMCFRGLIKGQIKKVRVKNLYLPSDDEDDDENNDEDDDEEGDDGDDEPTGRPKKKKRKVQKTTEHEKSDDDVDDSPTLSHLLPFNDDEDDTSPTLSHFFN